MRSSRRRMRLSAGRADVCDQSVNGNTSSMYLQLYQLLREFERSTAVAADEQEFDRITSKSVSELTLKY